MTQARRFTLESAKSGSSNEFMRQWDKHGLPKNNNLRTAIINAFQLSPTDDYAYHATASVTLTQVQVAIDHGNAHGMHAWYHDESGEQMGPPNLTDIEAYTQIFAPTTSTTKALGAFASNAKKGSLRSSIAQHIQENLLLPLPESGLALPAKQKTSSLTNPYFDFWSWSCACLEWAGPNAETVNVKQSHHILPIFYHHFGCVCPTYDALSLIQQLARPPKKGKEQLSNERPVLEIGSGNGYWSYLLRKIGVTVYACDNALSEWRTVWIADTWIADGAEFIKKRPASVKSSSEAPSTGSPGWTNSILLLVYPQVSHEFTKRVIPAFKGDTIVVAGTQNGNGFTAFKDESITTWMQRERPGFERIVQIPLPSFAGKDEALFIFSKRKEGKDGRREG